jgi:hypothetical protein
MQRRMPASASAVAWFFGDYRLTALTIAFSFLVILGGLRAII